MKQTKHSRKSEAQNLYSKCPPFVRTHAFKRLRRCAIADGFGDSVQSWWQVGATQLHFLEPEVKVNGDYYRNTFLLNMLLLDIRSVFGDYDVFQQDGAPAHRARDTVTMLLRDARVYPARDVATQFARFESGGLQYLGYASREGLPLVDP